MEEDPARRRLLDHVEHALDLIRKALHERAVVERRAELGSVHPVDPEVRILVESVERDVDDLDAVGRGSLAALVVASQVQDRADPVGTQRFPAGRTEPVQSLGSS